MLEIVLPIFSLIALGAIIGKFKKIEIDTLVFIIMYIAAPCLVISSLQKSTIQLSEFFWMMTFTLLVVFSLFILSGFVLRILKVKEKGLQLPMIFGNTGYLGFPVALLAFGVAGLSQAVIYSSVETVLLMSLGIFLANKKNDWKEIFKVPLIYAVIIALVFGVINYTLPALVLTPIDLIGQITIPLALLVLGYRLTKIKLKDTKKALLASIFKIGVGFIIALTIVLAFSLTGVVRDVLILQAAMPSAVLTMVITHSYKRNADLVASVVFISTLLSMITIPLLLWFLG